MKLHDGVQPADFSRERLKCGLETQVDGKNSGQTGNLIAPKLIPDVHGTRIVELGYCTDF